MDKKETVIVYCGSEPTDAMAKAMARLDSQGFIVHTVSPSDCDPKRLAGMEADLVLYNEAGTFDGMSEALDGLLRKGPKGQLFKDIDSRFTHERIPPSKSFDWLKFTKKVESTQRRKK
jgi:hypothetical protein